MTLLGVALLVIAAATSAGDAAEFVSRKSAATPATCGDAIEVPEMVFVAASPVAHADVILEPGAKMSTHVPKFENDERASVMVVEPTVMAFGARAGDCVQASALLLPAETAKVTPSFIAFWTAVSSDEEAPPPKLMFATAGVPVG